MSSLDLNNFGEEERKFIVDAFKNSAPLEISSGFRGINFKENPHLKGNQILITSNPTGKDNFKKLFLGKFKEEIFIREPVIFPEIKSNEKQTGYNIMSSCRLQKFSKEVHKAKNLKQVHALMKKYRAEKAAQQKVVQKAQEDYRDAAEKLDEANTENNFGMTQAEEIFKAKVGELTLEELNQE